MSVHPDSAAVLNGEADGRIAYASLCDGIGAAHAAWAPLGWRCAWTSEIEPFACSVVEHHRWTNQETRTGWALVAVSA